MKFILLLATAIALAKLIQARGVTNGPLMELNRALNVPYGYDRACVNCGPNKLFPEFNDRFLTYGMYGLAFPGAGYPIEGGTYAGAYGIGIESPLYGLTLGKGFLDGGLGFGGGIGGGFLDVGQGKGGAVVGAVGAGGLVVQEFTPTLLGYPHNQGPFTYGVGATQGLGSLHNPVLVGNQAQFGPLAGAEIFGLDPFYGPGSGFGLGAWGYRGSPAYDFVNTATDVYGYPDILENVPINVLQQQVNPIALSNAQYLTEIYPTLVPFGGYGWNAFN